MSEDYASSLFFYRDYWGFAEKPALSSSPDERYEEELGFLTALCNVAGADRKASQRERDHIKGYFAIKGFLPKVLEQVDAVADEAEHKTLEQIAADASKAMSIGTLRFAGRAIIYDAMKAAAQDGLVKEEMDAILVIAENMGISKDLVMQMKEAIEEEEVLKKKRITLCVPGHPCLAESYKSL